MIHKKQQHKNTYDWMTSKEGPGSGKHIRALALAAVFAAGCLGLGRPVTALAEEVTVIGPGALIQEEEAQAAAEEARQEEELSQEEILARQQAWAAELATLHLRYSIAGTEKPWLFYREAYEEKLKPLDRRYDLSWYKRVVREKLYTPLTQNGIRLVLMIVPDKDTLYTEYLPEGRRQALEAFNHVDQFMEYMKQEFPELEIYYAKEDMLKAKEQGLPLYYASDSHWNFPGAGACGEGLMRFLGEGYQLEEKPEIRYTLTGETTAGDLQTMEGLDESFNRVEYQAEGTWEAEKTYSYCDPATGEEIYAVFNSKDERALPKKLYFCGDSYRWYIQYILNGQFAESRFVQRYQYSASDALQYQPDVFVYEIPERFLEQLGTLIS